MGGLGLGSGDGVQGPFCGLRSEAGHEVKGSLRPCVWSLSAGRLLFGSGVGLWPGQVDGLGLL